MLPTLPRRSAKASSASRRLRNHLIGYTNLGALLCEEGRCEDLAIEPDYADAHYNLARLKELRGDKQGALRHYDRYRRIQGS